MTNPKTLAVDFDGVIHSYTSGWKGATTIPDAVTPGAIDFLVRASAMFEVKIYSTRAKSEPARAAMRLYLSKAGASDELLDSIEITNEKPPAVVYIDDRGFSFDGGWPDLDQIAAFEPWNRRRAIGQHATPRDLDHALAILLVCSNYSDEWAAQPRDYAITSGHHGIGRTMRNEWGLCAKEGPLYEWMVDHGFTHADDMSHVILEAAWCWHNGADLDLVGLRDQFRDHWANVGSDQGQPG